MGTETSLCSAHAFVAVSDREHINSPKNKPKSVIRSEILMTDMDLRK